MLDSWERECGDEFVLVALEVGNAVGTLKRAPCSGLLELVERVDSAQQVLERVSVSIFFLFGAILYRFTTQGRAA